MTKEHKQIAKNVTKITLTLKILYYIKSLFKILINTTFY